jgi:hypothetical protein
MNKLLSKKTIDVFCKKLRIGLEFLIMKKHGVLLFFFLIFVFSFLPISAQTNKKAELKRIEAYCKTVDAFTKRYKNPQSIYADTSDYNENSKPKWRKFASEKALEKFREKSETYTIAYNWLQRGKIIKSNFTLFSPSGDWANYVYHHFREDGTLAKAESEMRTFNGDLIIIQDFYFDRNGRLLKKTVKYLDLQTQKPIKPTKEFLENKGDFSSDVEYFKKTSKLPFAQLLKKRK